MISVGVLYHLVQTDTGKRLLTSFAIWNLLEIFGLLHVRRHQTHA